MKRSSVILSAVAFCAVLAVLGYLPPQKAYAEGEVVCTINVSSSFAVDTQKVTDGGLTCPWAAGSAVIMQCPNVEVCYDPAAPNRLSDGGLPQTFVRLTEADGGLGPTDGGTLADGGVISTTADMGPVATTSDLCVSFVSSPDPILIGLNPNQKNISLILNSAADAGTGGVCKFAATRRRIPAP